MVKNFGGSGGQLRLHVEESRWLWWRGQEDGDVCEQEVPDQTEGQHGSSDREARTVL